MSLLCMKEPSQYPNSCDVNFYEDLGSGVGWHAEGEELLALKSKDIRPISVLLGQQRSFEIRSNHSEGEHIRLLLGDGDIGAMEGRTQEYYRHRAPKEIECIGPG